MPQIGTFQGRFKFTSVAFLAATAVCFLASGVQAQEQPKRLSFTAADAPWSVTLPAAGFVVQEKKTKPDGTGAYYFLTDSHSSLNVSFFIEQAVDCKDSRICRDMVRDLGNPEWENATDFKSGELGDISYFEFLIPSFQNKPIRQQNFYAEFVVDGYWLDLHMSKVLFEPKDHRLFEDLVKAIKFERKSA